MLLTVLGALGIGLTLARRAFRLLRGRRYPNEWPVEFLFFTGGLGWSLLVPGALALILLRGDPGPIALLIVSVTGVLTIMLVGGGTLFGLVFLTSEKLDYRLMAIIHLPAILFFSVAFRLLTAAWRVL
jgi:hypothetical protein